MLPAVLTAASKAMGFGDLGTPAPGAGATAAKDSGKASKAAKTSEQNATTAPLPRPIELLSAEDFSHDKQAALDALAVQQASPAWQAHQPPADSPLVQLPRLTRRFPGVLDSALAPSELEAVAAGQTATGAQRRLSGTGICAVRSISQPSTHVTCRRCGRGGWAGVDGGRARSGAAHRRLQGRQGSQEEGAHRLPPRAG